MVARPRGMPTIRNWYVETPARLARRVSLRVQAMRDHQEDLPQCSPVAFSSPRRCSRCCPSRPSRRERNRRSPQNPPPPRSEEHTSELQSRPHLVCRLLLEKKNKHQTPFLLLKKKKKKQKK